MKFLTQQIIFFLCPHEKLFAPCCAQKKTLNKVNHPFVFQTLFSLGHL